MLIKIIYISTLLFIWFLSKLICIRLLKNIIPPIFLASIFIIVLLWSFHIPLKEFELNVSLINYLLGPATVLLAIPLYREINLLKKYFKQIILGVFISASLSLIFTFGLAYCCNLSNELIQSILPHSVTTPIGIDISNLLKGVKSITVASIILSGLLGALIAVPIFKLINIESPIAKGIAIGSTSHAVGTSKALEIGKTEGALSSLAIPLTAIVTALICSCIA